MVRTKGYVKFSFAFLVLVAAFCIGFALSAQPVAANFQAGEGCMATGETGCAGAWAASDNARYVNSRADRRAETGLMLPIVS